MGKLCGELNSIDQLNLCKINLSVSNIRQGFALSQTS